MRVQKEVVTQDEEEEEEERTQAERKPEHTLQILSIYPSIYITYV